MNTVAYCATVSMSKLICSCNLVLVHYLNKEFHHYLYENLVDQHVQNQRNEYFPTFWLFLLNLHFVISSGNGRWQELVIAQLSTIGYRSKYTSILIIGLHMFARTSVRHLSLSLSSLHYQVTPNDSTEIQRVGVSL